MKTISVGDLHGLDLWKEINPEEYDKIIFMGDYVDSFTLSDKQIYENLKEIITFKKENMDKVILLLGNHDLQYMFEDKLGLHMCSGYRPTMYDSLYLLFNENKELFQVAYQHENTLWTHAGIHKGWYNQRFKKEYEGDTLADVINTAFNDYYIPLFDVGHRRGGWHDVGGPFWCDQVELSNSPLRNINQVVGHTRKKHILKENRYNIELVFIDVLEETNKPNFYEKEFN